VTNPLNGTTETKGDEDKRIRWSKQHVAGETDQDGNREPDGQPPDDQPATGRPVEHRSW
jgi:hypothetical protein